MKLPKHLLLLLLSLFCVLQSCKKKEVATENIDLYSDYVSAYPHKQISTRDAFIFQLNRTIDKQTIDENAFSISPKLKGEVTLEDRTVSFIPKEKLKSDTKYTVTLHLDKLFNDVAKDQQEFTLELKTFKLDLSVSLFSPELISKDWYKITGVLKASDYIDYDKAIDIIKTTYKGNDPTINLEKTGEYAKKFHFTVDSIQRFEQDQVLKVEWDGKGAVNSSSTGSREFTITGKSNFKLLEAQVFNEGKQRIELSFSDPISKTQNLKGLIQLLHTKKSDYTYKVKNNVITVFPKSYQTNKLDIEVFKGIKNTDGYSLKSNVVRTLYFEQLKPKVEFVKSGSLLPSSQNLKINFRAVNLRAVDVKVYKVFKDNVFQFLQRNNLNNKGSLVYVGRPVSKYTVNLSDKGLTLSKFNAFAIDLSDFVAIEKGAMYRVELSYNKEYSVYSCDGEVSDKTIVYGKKEVNTKGFDGTSNSYYYDDDYYEDYSWRDRENPCTNSYYRNKKVSSNILATNLGVIVKKGNNGKTFISVTDIVSTSPVDGAAVSLVNLQQQEITNATTNSEGIAIFENVEGAYFAKVSKDESTTYIKLNDGNALSMSKFDVSGAKIQEGLKGYIYGERGVWRPGDQLFLTFVLNDKDNPLPSGHPIKFELKDPKGNIVDRKVLNKNASNVYAYAPRTDADALTGNWSLRVKVGAVSFGKQLKIETIKPNRLKIKLKTEGDFIKARQPIVGKAEVKWLHGATAKGLKYDIESKLSQTKTSFPNFKNYTFDDVTRKYNTDKKVISKGNLNQEGKVSFSKKPSINRNAPGMLRASFITKVYENGGDFSTDVYTTKLSPYISYAGVEVAEEKQSRNYLFTDQDYEFNVATVDENGKGFRNRLDIKVYKLNWRWWWSSSRDGLSYYDGTREQDHYTSKQVQTGSDGKGSFKLKVSKYDWGRYLIKVKDLNSGHVSSKVIYYDWPSWYGQKKNSQDKTNATMLVFSSDKSTYEVGENATVKFPSTSGGRALVTIENGTEVLDHYWVTTNDKQTEFTFPVQANYTPNVFVNISLLQPHAQTKNDLPIRMYGAIPIEVYDKNTKLSPVLEMPAEFKPETSVNVSVSEQEGKAMYYTIALVDEGLLDLTRFKTPNPWKTFYRKQSLGVKTWDVFDDIIGAYGGEVHQILSIGGDEAEAGSKNKKANRFKPVVRYLGPFRLEANEVKSHQIDIPNYVGSVRAMVVASNPETEGYGSTEKTAFVRKPLMVLASLPRKITPKETVVLPVTVFAMKSHVKDVKVSIKTANTILGIEGDQSQRLRFTSPDEKMAYFTLKVKDTKGIAKVNIEATSGSEKATYEVEIDVFNPNPISTEVSDYVLQPSERKQIEVSTFGTIGTNDISLELSTVPPMNFTKRLGYLIHYPHGCVEQTTSSGFLQLYLTDLFELSQEKKFDIDRNIKATINRLKNFQQSGGGLSYWPRSSYDASPWGSNYAGHFMLEAEKKGYALPIGFKSKWIDYQMSQAKQWRKKDRSSYRDDAFTQAYRLYTLALANSADLASMNRLRETSGLTNQTKKRLAAAYALVGKKTIAENILSTLGAETNVKNSYRYNYGSVTRDMAMSLETYVLLGDHLNAGKLAKEIAKKLSSDAWYSTQTTAYSLLSMTKFALKNGTSSGLRARYSFNSGKEVPVDISKALFIVDVVDVKKNNQLMVTNQSTGVLYASVINKGILPVGEEKEIQKNLEANVSYFTKNMKPLAPSELQQGTNFIAEIKIKNPSGSYVDNIALTHYLPSGWEIINTRFTDYGSDSNTDKVDYIDIRDASTSYYFSLGKYKSKTFKIQLNASYLGDYYLPGIQAEAMYDNDYIVRTKGQWVKVVK